MPLDGNRLGLAIASKLASYPSNPNQPITGSELQQMWIDIATEIINEFKNNAVVASTGTTTGVQTGSSTAPTTTTGTIS